MKTLGRQSIWGTLRALPRNAHRRLPGVALTAALLLAGAASCRTALANFPSPRALSHPIQQAVAATPINLSRTHRHTFRHVMEGTFQWLQVFRTWEARDWNWILGAAAALILTSFLWVETLRRRLRRQNILVQEWARRERALKKKYEELFENATDIVYTTDLEGKVTSVNRAAERITGHRRAEVLGRSIFDYVAEEHRQTAEQMFRHKLEDDAATTYSMAILTRDGRKVSLEVSSRLLRADGKPTGVQGIARDITERKILEQKLARRDKRLASFFAAAPAGLAILDNQLRFVRINETLAQLTDLGRQENIGKSVRETLPNLAPNIETVMRRVLTEGEPVVNFSHEGETPGQPGIVRHFISSYFPIPALEEEATEVAVIAVEVTDRKRAEEALRQSEERLNSILSSLRDVVWSVTPEDRRVLYMNPATETVYGRKASEFYQHPGLWQKITHPDDQQQLVHSFARLLQAGSVDQEFRILRPDGEVRWLYDRSRAIRNSEGTIIRLDGISTDITELKQIEQRLRLYKEIFAHSTEAVAIADPEFRFLEQNGAHRQLLGYSDEEIRRLSPDALMGEEAFQEPRRKLRDAPSFRFETVLQTRSGKKLDAEVSAFSILNGEGEMLCHVGLIRDITERKRIEIERQSAREAAEAASRAKSEFLANMSHEIRTPLNGVLGMTELALSTKLSEEQREYLTLVKTSGETLLTVINDILDFSKIEAGRLDLNPIEFDLRDTLGDTLKTLSLRAHEKGLELALHVSHGVPYRVKGDPTRLRQIVVNLVGNAVKFTDQGEVVLHADMESKTEQETILHFIVTDTGIGIPTDKQRLIFAPFTQADSSATRRYGGTGLGLTICRQLVELMGGRLWVESEEGKGSSFHFTVCFQPATSGSEALTQPEKVELEGMRTLVVDDNATNRRLLEEILAGWGMKPAMADGGWTGLEVMRQAKAAGRPFPLVLIDALMPEMDGFTLAERIKENPELSPATIMMLTSGGQRGDAARCRKLGIAAYLHKPVKERDLLHAVLLALSPQRKRAKDAELITRHTLRQARHNLRILLAEDDLVNRQLAEHILRKLGHRVTSVSDGQKAVEAIQASGLGSFDVALMDVQMPEMDGVEATAAIRAIEKGQSQRLSIIAMTAHAMKGDQARFLKAGMDGYIAKPIQARALASLIERTFSGRPEPERNPPPKEPPQQVIDCKRGLAAVEGDSELFHDLLKLFARETPAALDKLRAAVRLKDAPAIQLAAHKLKGSVSNFGAEDAVRALAMLEATAKTGDLAHCGQAFHSIEQEMDRVLAAIESLESEVPG